MKRASLSDNGDAASAARAALEKTLQPEKLALLAATVVRGTKTPAKDAVKYAYELWAEARKLLSPGARYQLELNRRGLKDSESFSQATADIPLPRKFPAKLKDFLRLIVKARTEADAMARYRKFLGVQLKEGNSSQKVEDIIQRNKTEGFPDATAWKLDAMSYRKWWTVERSKKAADSARKRKALDAQPAAKT